jgi:capsular polysaccharide biosynthesis protein
MDPGSGVGGGWGGRRWASLLLAASARLYGVLLGLYPKAFRRRYGAEMRRDFADLSREVLGEGGGAGLARVWGAAFSDLAITALMERSAVLPRISARATGAIVLMAATVAMASSILPPQYEASAKVKVVQGPLPEGQLVLLGSNVEEFQQFVQTMVARIQTRLVAEEVIQREGLDTTPQAFVKNLTVEQSQSTLTVDISYKSPDPQEAQRVVNAVSDVSSERLSGISAGSAGIKAKVWQHAAVAAVSPNPLRNGLLVLVSGLLVCMGLAFALPRVAASGIGRASLRAAGTVCRTVSGSRGMPATSPATKDAKEKELLEALARRGKLTVAGVALETSLTVEEANRMLSELAAKGHIEVAVEHGRLLYSLREGDAPRDGAQ